MLKKLTLFIAVVSLSLFCSDYVMSRSAAPPAGNTNAPTEQSCAKTGCHKGTLNGGPGSVNLTFDAADYTPGSTHTITVSVSDSAKTRFGFQATSLDNADSMMGTFIVTNATTTGTQSLSGRDYINHKSAGSTSSWSFDWTAPAAGTGDVTFYVTGNAANFDGQTTGDNIYADEFVWSEGSSSGPVTITGASEICEDATASFTASAGFSSYKWSTGDTSSTIVYAGTSSGIKTIWVLADSGLSSETTDTVMLMVHPTPDGPLVMDSSSLDELHISNVTAGSTYQWYKGTSKMTGETDTMLNYTEANDYYVEVTDSNGCTNTSNTVSVTLFVSIKYNMKASLQVYPNPSTGLINISNAFGYNVEVMNINGQLVHNVSSLATDNLQVELPSGMYFVKVQNETSSKISKVVVR